MPKRLEEMESLFKALADTTRLRILGLLLAGEVCVCDIHESLKIPQPKTSRHLAYLRRTGLVETRRDGLWIHYRLGKLPDPVMAAIVDAVAHALTHVDPVHRDAERLAKRTGHRVIAVTAATTASCCAPVAVTGVNLTMAVQIERAQPVDMPEVFGLLERNHLPKDGLTDHVATTLVARDDRTVVGSAALEVYRDGALLRSVAVAPEAQGRGVGRALTEAALELAQELQVPAIYLLTTTADGFFPKFGFERTTRADVPAGVQSSIEFASACPSTATVMRKPVGRRL